ncbi:MAG: AAA family ATPase [Planctomycetaceae bacterium]
MHYDSHDANQHEVPRIDPFTQRLINRAHQIIAEHNALVARKAANAEADRETVDIPAPDVPDCETILPEEASSLDDDDFAIDPADETGCESDNDFDDGELADEPFDDAAGYTARPIALVEREELEWLWPRRIPIGKVTILAGLPGIGKSLVATDWAARVSTGNGWPGSTRRSEPASVLIINAEDSLHDTILPRLTAAGADAKRILTIDADRWDSIDLRQQKRVRLGECVELLEDSLEERPEIRLVVIDPISAFCSDVDTLSQTDVRVLLGALGRIATRHKVAIVAVAQLTKSPTRESVDRAIGALTFAASARAVWILAPHPEDPEYRLMLPGKSNLAPAGDEISFSIRNGRIHWSKHRFRTQWERDTHSLDERRELRTPAVREAAAWLRNQLAQGPLPARDLRKDAVDCGFSWRILCSAKKVLDVRTTREGFGAQGVWHWHLSEPADTEVEPVEVAATAPEL